MCFSLMIGQVYCLWFYYITPPNIYVEEGDAVLKKKTDLKSQYPVTFVL